MKLRGITVDGRREPVVFVADTPSLRQTMLQAFRGDPTPPMTEVEAMARRYLGLDAPTGEERTERTLAADTDHGQA